MEALRVSGDELARRLAQVRPDHWTQASAVGDWSVFDLVNHVIGGGRRYVMLFDGADLASIQATRAQNHVGADPVSSHSRLAEELAARFAEPGALARTLQHPAGERTGLQLLRMRIAEQALHAVDLARSLDLDDMLDAQLVDFMLVDVAPDFEFGRNKGFFGAVPEIAAEATPQQRLLALSGR